MKIKIHKQVLTSEKGFTLAEALSSLVLLSIVMILLVKMALSLPSSFLSNRDASISLRHQWILYNTLKKEIEQVRPPWWIQPYIIEEKNDHWIFPWYKGNEEQELSLLWNERECVLTTGEKYILTMSLSGSEEIEMEWNQRQDGYTYFQIRSKGLLGELWIFPVGCTPIRGLEEE